MSFKKSYSDTHLNEMLIQLHKNDQLKKKNKKEVNTISLKHFQWMHVGVGRFHRSHQCYLLQNINLNHPTEKWDIIGINLRENDSYMVNSLKSQDCNYILNMKSNKYDTITNINIIKNILNIPDFINSETYPLNDYIKYNDNIKVISMTITEKGYYMNNLGDLDFSNNDVQYDIKNWNSVNGLKNPKTIYGFIATIVFLCLKYSRDPFCVISCDNIPNNSYITKLLLIQFLGKINVTLSYYVKKHILFLNTMVDSITPIPTITDHRLLWLNHNKSDKELIISEKYKLWVIEKTSKINIYKLPEWQLSNDIIITKHVELLENVKLLLLNSLHTYIALYSLYLLKNKKLLICNVLKNKKIYNEAKSYIDEVKLSLPDTFESLTKESYIKTVFERFQNNKIKDTIQRILQDTSYKLKMTLKHCLDHYHSYKKTPILVSKIFALFIYYLCHCNHVKKKENSYFLKIGKNINISSVKYILKPICEDKILNWNNFVLEIMNQYNLLISKF